MNIEDLPSLNHPTGQPNFTEVVIGKLTLWYSYQTIVGFSHPSDPHVVQENRWGTTTGNHLNYIDNGDKKTRVDVDEFARRLEAVLSEMGPDEIEDPFTVEEMWNS